MRKSDGLRRMQTIQGPDLQFQSSELIDNGLQRLFHRRWKSFAVTFVRDDRCKLRETFAPVSAMRPNSARLLDDVSVTFELVPDRRPDEIGTVRVEAFLNHQIDVAKVDIAKIDRNFSVSGGLGRSSALYLPTLSPSSLDVSSGLSRACAIEKWSRLSEQSFRVDR